MTPSQSLSCPSHLSPAGSGVTAPGQAMTPPTQALMPVLQVPTLEPQIAFVSTVTPSTAPSQSLSLRSQVSCSSPGTTTKGGSVAWQTLLRMLLSGYRGFSAFRLLEPTSQQVAAPSM